DSVFTSNSVIRSWTGIPFKVLAGGIGAMSDDTSQLTLGVERSTLTRNQGSGGGIVGMAAGTSDLHVAVDDSVLFRNRGRGDSDGGAVGAYSLLVGGGSLALSISGSVITGNRTGGIICTSVDPCTLTNDIVSNNSGG